VLHRERQIPRRPGYIARHGPPEGMQAAVASSLAVVTISGHNVTMKQVRIAELKARLSEYLRAVKRGETIAVLDRETPVAQIIPIRDRTPLRIRKPALGTPPPGRVPLPKPLKLNIDVVQMLLEERQLHR
jgi:prevent-host-death family protein